MKFVSKNVNLRVVLRPGVEANRLAGFPGTPGVYVKFQDGIADVRNEEYIKMMLDHPGYNADYILMNEGDADPYIKMRQESEPQHFISEVKYGQVTKTMSSPTKTVLPKELDELIQKRVEAGIKDGLEKIIEFEMAKRNASLEPNRTREIEANADISLDETSQEENCSCDSDDYECEDSTEVDETADIETVDEYTEVGEPDFLPKANKKQPATAKSRKK